MLLIPNGTKISNPLSRNWAIAREISELLALVHVHQSAIVNDTLSYEHAQGLTTAINNVRQSKPSGANWPNDEARVIGRGDNIYNAIYFLRDTRGRIHFYLLYRIQ